MGNMYVHMYVVNSHPKMKNKCVWELIDNTLVDINYIKQFFYYPDQQMNNIHILFYVSQALLHVSKHLHHLQGVLSFAKVIKFIKVSNSIMSVD